MVPTMLFYISKAGEISSSAIFGEQLKEGFAHIPGGEKMGMTYAEHLRMEGRAEGRQEGEVMMLLRQLQRKFGFLPETYRKRVEKADSETLLALGDKVLEAQTLQQLFDEEVLA